MADELPDGWIPHDGGPCPIDPQSYPSVMFRNGDVDEDGEWKAFWWSEPIDWWQHEGDDCDDIIAYRITPIEGTTP